MERCLVFQLSFIAAIRLGGFSLRGFLGAGMGEAERKDRLLAAEFVYGLIKVDVIHAGEKSCFGWKRGCFGVVPLDQHYQIFHLPSALSLRQAGGFFRRDIDAFRAVVEIDRLRNEWETITLEEWNLIAKPIFKICMNHFGHVVLGGEKTVAVENRHNGFTGHLPN